MDKSNGYLPKVIELLNKIENEQYENLRAAANLMADAIENDRLIHVYGGGGHTTLPVGEMFFRAGGLCNINPCMETGLSVFNQAQKYLALERCVNYGRSIMEYYNLQKDDVLIIYHNIGTNPATIDAAMLSKMADLGVFGNALVDGPLAMDNILSAAAAEKKGIRSAVAGHADILLSPSIEVGNVFSKTLSYVVHTLSAGIVAGTAAPIILPSRSSDPKSKYASLALGVLLAK